ncbi:hypothetical protein [Mesorhizobium sp.]|uniref:hypothetical protein n=1 Tax=Mesorhizobium sp. TaxID=1871066 RepID=UPI0025C3F71B|nr:hypothetical protein [Mesorhizobium sp.]
MTIEEYYAAIKQLGLTPTKFLEIFITRDGRPQSVPLAANYSYEERLVLYEMVRAAVEG